MTGFTPFEYDIAGKWLQLLKDAVPSGGLMSYGPDSNALHRAAADYVDRMLKGAKPEDLPVQAPNKTDLTINLKTAKALAITIPQSVLLQANEVIR